MVVKFEHSEQTFFVDKQISNYRSIETWNIFYIFDQRQSIQLLIISSITFNMNTKKKK